MNKICLCCGKALADTAKANWHPFCIKRMFNRTVLPTLNIDYEQITNSNLDEGKTVTGVQKKFSLDFSVLNSRKTLKIANNQYIIKTLEERIPNIIQYEWVGMKLAEIVGITTVECGLLKNKDEYIYITKRIDREQNKKIPMEDFCQLSNTQTEYKYNGSYEKCYKNVIEKYSDYKTIDKIKFYKIVLFSYIIGNTDMHLKNFSLYKPKDKYILTPAYDLVPVLMVFNQPEMALTINDKNKNLTINDFIKFGLYMDIEKRIINIINRELLSKKSKMIDFINNSILDDENKLKFIQFIEDRINGLFGETK